MRTETFMLISSSVLLFLHDSQVKITFVVILAIICSPGFKAILRLSSDWQPLTGKGFEQQVGVASVLTTKAL